MKAMRTCGFYLVLAWACLWLRPGPLSSALFDMDWCGAPAPYEAEERRCEVAGDVPDDPETVLLRASDERPAEPAVEVHALPVSIRLRYVAEAQTPYVDTIPSCPPTRAYRSCSPRAPPYLLS